MAVPSSGTISLAGIKAEVDNNAYNASATAETSLGTIATETIFNENSSSIPNATAPHAMSEWYGYDHDAAAAFVNAKAVQKSTSTGTANQISFVDADDTFNFTGTTAWSISFWIKVGWTVNLNDNVHFIIGQKNNADKQIADMIKIIYNEATNRIECRYGNVAGSSHWYNQGGWLFHSQSSQYVAGYNAAGLGSTFWNKANRGYTNSDGYTMITITKSTTNTAASMKLYWNATGIGAAPIQSNVNSSLRSSNGLSTTNDRRWSIGSNGIHSGQSSAGQQRKCGDEAGDGTKYNDLTIWNKQLSDSEVSSLYNSGTVIDATGHSASSNLVGYWKFEGNGNDTIHGEDNFTVSGSSAIVNK